MSDLNFQRPLKVVGHLQVSGTVDWGGATII